MTKNKNTQVNSTIESVNIQLVLPLNFEVVVPENDSVRLLSQIVEEMDLSSLKMAYSSVGRNPAIPPRILFKILTYAYMEGIYSSRQIEKVCKRDVNFMWLLEGFKAPEHSTISRFRKDRLGICMSELFKQLVLKLYEIGEVSFENMFIDGTKIEANANKYTFVWEKSINKYDAKLNENVFDLCTRINNSYETDFSVTEENMLETLRQIAEFLLERKELLHLGFVSGSGTRKSQLQRDCEETLGYLERKEKYASHFAEFKGRSNYCKTDPDATFMHMKEDHMRNSQLKPGYNLQIGVEGGYVVFTEAFSNRSDVNTLTPFLNHFRECFHGIIVPNIIADAGYESEENYEYLKRNGQVSYIKPQTYEQWNKRSFKNIIGKRENMQYDKDRDEYTCNQGRILKVSKVYIGKVRRKDPYETTYTEYECESCEGCSVKEKCTRAAGNRKMKVSKNFIELRNESLKNITSPQGILLRMNRSIQAEGAFGAIKADAGFRRFYTRGKTNISTEFMLLCFGFNLNKLHKKMLNGKTGQLLHCEEKVA